MSEFTPGEVVTFYSYTGGTGRSMAVANLGCLLARRCAKDQRVLMVDWSLESPGLHRYFSGAGQVTDGAPGLIDMFSAFSEQIGSGHGEQIANTVFKAVDPESYVLSTGISGLSLLRAGRIDSDYFGLATTFDWQSLDERAPWLIPSLVDYWRRHYRFILIDSRSGINDMSGLCTMSLPDKLIALFTLNQQSLEGVVEVMRYAAEYRKAVESKRPLIMFPLPSRVENTEAKLRDGWRHGPGDQPGYESRFETLMQELYNLSGCRLHNYFSDVQLPYLPRYAYGEDIASLVEAVGHPSNLLRAYQALADRVAGRAHPWEDGAADSGPGLVEVDGVLVPIAEARVRLEEAATRRRRDRDIEGAGRALQSLASLEERANEYDAARGHYEQAITLFRNASLRLPLAAVLEDLAQMERRIGAIDRARTLYAEAVELYRLGHSNWRFARALQFLADLEARLGSAVEARQHYVHAIELYRGERDNLGLAVVCLSLAGLERKAGDPEAEGHYHQAVDLFRGERENGGLAAALRGLADLQRRLGKLDDARRNYERAVDLCQGDSDPLALAGVLHGLADVERRLKEVEHAERHYHEAIGLYRGLDDGLALANALQSLAELESRIGKTAEAGKRYEDALGLFRGQENKMGIANTLRSLGDLERRLGKIAEARGRYAEAMGLYETQNNNLGQANSMQSLGDLEKLLGKLEEAQAHYHQAASLYRKEKANLGLANTLKSHGDVEAETGNLKGARDHYEQAIELYRAEQNNIGLANALQSLGDLERGRKAYKEAVSFYNLARELYRSERSKAGLAYTCSELARVSHVLFDFGGSIQYMTEAMAAATEANVPTVMGYVLDVQREIRGEIRTGAAK